MSRSETPGVLPAGLELAPASPVRDNWLSLKAAVTAYVRYEAHYKTRYGGERDCRLAWHAAFPLFLSPDLINLIHANFLGGEGIPWHAEADFLLSPLCRPVGDGLYRVDPIVREILLVELVQHMERPAEQVLRLADFLLAYAERYPAPAGRSEVVQAYRWIAAAYLRPAWAAGDMRRALEETAKSIGTPAELLAQAQQLHVALLAEVLHPPLAAGLPAPAYADVLEASEILARYWYRGPEAVALDPAQLSGEGRISPLKITVHSTIRRAEVRRPENWYKNAVFYEVFVRAFNDSNADGIGDLPGLTAKLDYLQWLGVDAVWMLPIFPSPLRDDGYDVADYCAVHSDYGTLDDVRRLIEEAHHRDLRIIVELIPNHTSDQNFWFQASRDPNHPEHTKYRDWYVWSDTDQKYLDTRIVFLDTEPSNWTFDPLRGQYYWHRFFSHQPDLNYDNPEVQRAMLEVVQFWLDLGADAFRMDATPYLYEREGTSCENLPETHAYLKRLRAFVDAYAPGTMLLSEANMWPEDVRPYLGGDPTDPSVPGDEFHMNFHFPLMPRIFMALAKADRTPILDILAHTPPIPANCQWGMFLRCHDELTLEMVTPEERRFMWDFYAPEPRMRLNMGIRRRLAPLLSNDRQRIELANSILFTLPGSPVIYYGDEIGMGDNIWLEDRDGERTPMQWDDTRNAGFSAADPSALGDPVIEDEVFGYRRVNVATQRLDSTSLLNRMRNLIQVRKLHPALAWGDMFILEPQPVEVLAFLRSFEGDVVLILHNLSDSAQRFTLNLDQFIGRRPVDLFTDELLPAIGAGGYDLALPAHRFRWLGL